MLAAQQRLAVVFDRDGALAPAELLQEVGDGRAVGERDALAVGRDGDAYFFAAAALAAAFFSALNARTLSRLAASTMSATDMNVPGLP